MQRAAASGRPAILPSCPEEPSRRGLLGVSRAACTRWEKRAVLCVILGLLAKEAYVVVGRALKPLGYTVRFAREILPMVAAEMERWHERASGIPDPVLRRQALASLRAKRFHAEGGSVFAAAEPQLAGGLVPLIVALQTISDYLDNLVDRTGSVCEHDFRALHQAFLDALDTEPAAHDYYTYHPHKDDGGYLAALVAECRSAVRGLPDYGLVAAEVLRQAQRYCDLQVYKHLTAAEREKRLIGWERGHPDRCNELAWWEFAAACGSTLGIFALFLEAARGTNAERVAAIASVYFPWICGVHILLDYLIDQEEDRIEGDLNFVSYYASRQAALGGMQRLVREAGRQVRRLPDAPFHQAVLEGLLGLYLTDAKVREQRLRTFAIRLLSAASPRAWTVFTYCSLWRRLYGRT